MRVIQNVSISQESGLVSGIGLGGYGSRYRVRRATVSMRKLLVQSPAWQSEIVKLSVELTEMLRDSVNIEDACRPLSSGEGGLLSQVCNMDWKAMNRHYLCRQELLLFLHRSTLSQPYILGCQVRGCR